MTEFTKDDLDFETLLAEDSNIRLESSATTCEICKNGAVVRVGRETNLVIYTRCGTKRGTHIEMRCNNRSLPCRAGHYYGSNCLCCGLSVGYYSSNPIFTRYI